MFNLCDIDAQFDHLANILKLGHNSWSPSKNRTLLIFSQLLDSSKPINEFIRRQVTFVGKNVNVNVPTVQPVWPKISGCIKCYQALNTS